MVSTCSVVHIYEQQHAPAYPIVLLHVGLEQRSSSHYAWDPEQHHHEKVWVLQFTESGSGRIAWERDEPPGKLQIKHQVKQQDQRRGQRGEQRGEAQVERGRGFAINPSLGGYRYWCPDTPWTFRWLSVRGPFADELCLGMTQESPRISYDPASPAYQRFCELTGRLLSGDQPSISADEVFLTTTTLLLALFHENTGRDRLRGTLAPPSVGVNDEVEQWMRTYVHTHLKGVSVDDIARQAGYHPKYFIGLCRRHTGMTPHEFILREKIGLAARLLRETSQPLVEIAEYLGFRDQFHFARVFKQRIGIPPGAYRRANQHPLAARIFI